MLGILCTLPEDLCKPDGTTQGEHAMQLTRALSAVLCLAVSAANAETRAAEKPGAATDQELHAKLDDYLQRLEAFGFSGPALLARNGHIVLAKGYGLADRERKIPFTADTVISIGSITKQFTAAAILKLEMQGKLQVTDPISKYFTQVPPDKAPITLHHLLTHASGLESDFGPSDFERVSREEIIKRALASKLLWTPGKQYHYSNAGYSLLGAIVEMVSGQGYETYLRENLFLPAGMKMTGYRLADWKPAATAQGYERGGKRWGTILERPWAADGPYWNLRANGAIHSTLPDMYRWHQALDGEIILSAQAKQKLFTSHIREEVGGTSFYGYGWTIFRTPRGTKLIAHNGGNGIFAADFRRYVDEGVVLLLASNNAAAPATRLSNWVAGLVFGANYPAPPRIVALEPGPLARLAGTYSLAPGNTLAVRVQGGHLLIAAKGSQSRSLLAGATPVRPERIEELTRRTEEVVAGLFKKDYAALHRAFGGRVPLNELKARATQNRGEMEEEHGRWKSFKVELSVPRKEVIESYVRLQFERGEDFLCYVWDGGNLRGIRQVSALPGGERIFLPHSANEFATFDFDSASAVTITFKGNPDAPASALVFPDNDAAIVAHRLTEKSTASEVRPALMRESDATSIDSLRQIVDQCNRRAIEDFKKGDMLAVARGYADDATIYFPRGKKVHGRKAIDRYWQGVKGPRDWKLETIEVGGTREAIYEVGKSSLTTEVDGKTNTYVCDYVVIWKRQMDGNLAHTDIFN
jgi:CubicO group peptidase (beta-lactamase class C family)/ketosteroid isomerase-like protein